MSNNMGASNFRNICASPSKLDRSGGERLRLKNDNRKFFHDSSSLPCLLRDSDHSRHDMWRHVNVLLNAQSSFHKTCFSQNMTNQFGVSQFRYYSQVFIVSSAGLKWAGEQLCMT